MTPRRIADYLTWYDVDDNGCWNWFARKTVAGYGMAGRAYAHRFFYEQHVGPIPAGLTIDHLCPTARNGNKTHCKHGHEFTEENTYSPPSGGRGCRTCIRRREHAWRKGKAA